ncbi:GTP cyclohydrolase II [Cordyceps javanica]|nr:GTP cyclohydrolase II [Cordyceps javanica]
MTHSGDDQNIVNSLNELRNAQSQLTAAVETLTAAVGLQQQHSSTAPATLQRDPTTQDDDTGRACPDAQNSSSSSQKSGFTSRIVLTGGSYSVYYALAVASKELNTDHRPDYTNTEPAANIGPFPQWGDKNKIVAMDPWGHLTPWQYQDIMQKENIDLRPTIAITKAHMKLPELEDSVRSVVYNARKRGADRASDYFTRTENIAGVKDMRFQALMPDILHWLGIKKIDRMLSMSNMKHDAIVGQGIPIHERVELPEELIPADSRVEIDAKITAGYFTAGKRLTSEELQSVQGRMWEDIDH